MSVIVLDSAILIDVLRGHGPAVDFLQQLDTVPVCSEITRVEVLRGMRSNERPAVETLFHALDWIPLDEIIARRAGHLGRRWRRSHAGLSSADLVIAATVEEVDGRLATANVRHFPMFEGLTPPY
jgi:predicted nucleic acid-binding protein